MSDWITHCKEYQKKNGCTYKEAMVKARASYKPKPKLSKSTQPISVKKPAKKKEDVGKPDAVVEVVKPTRKRTKKEVPAEELVEAISETKKVSRRKKDLATAE